MDEKNKRWIVRIVLIVVNLVLAGVLTYVRYPVAINMGATIPLVHALSDGFIVVGFFNFALGALIKISNTGFFDIFGYSAKAILNFFVPRSIFRNEEDFYEYKIKKAEKRKEMYLFNAMFWVGLIFVGLSLVLTLILYV